MTLGDLARRVGGRVTGDPSVEIRSASGIEDAGPGDVTFIAHPRYAARLSACRASAVITTPELAPRSPLPALAVADPNHAFMQAAGLLLPPRPVEPPGLHRGAWIDPDARLGAGVRAGPGAVVAAGAVVGDRCVLSALSFVGRGARLGADCVLHPLAAVLDGCLLGDRVILQPGAIVGSDGFGYATVGGVHLKIPQLGIAVLEDDVELGSCSTVDRARVGRTVVGRGTKIDNLVQVAHNVELGQGCLVAAQAGVAGSTRLGRYVVVGGQVGIGGHLEIGDQARLAAQSGVIGDLAGRAEYSGHPAMRHVTDYRRLAALGRLPDLIAEVRRLEKRVAELEKPAPRRPAKRPARKRR